LGTLAGCVSLILFSVFDFHAVADHRLGRASFTIAPAMMAMALATSILAYFLGRATESCRAEAEVRQGAERLRTTFESIPDGLCVLDRDGRYSYLNSEAERYFGRARKDLLGKVIWEEYPELEGTNFGREYRRAVEENCKVTIEDYYAPLDRWFEIHVYCSAEGLAVYFRDVTERHRSQEQLKLLETSIARLNDIVLITTASPGDGVQRIAFVNDAFERYSGYGREEVIGETPLLLVGARTEQAELERVEHAILNWLPVRAELICYTKSGEEFWIEIDGVPVTDATGSFTHWVAVGRDITERKAAEEEIQYLAFYDPLTRLPNRKLLLDRLEQAFTRAKRSGQWGAAMFLDLDQFKLVNDTHGHQTGDDFLQHISERLVEELRASDTIARYGGDEFVVILEDLGESEEAAMMAARHVAQKIRHRLSQPAALESGTITVSASQGIALFPAPEQMDAQEVLRHGDIALYRSKESGRDHVCIFESFMASELSERLALDQALRGALDRQEFSLYLQSKANAQARLVGAEVLLRWKHPEMGMVSPSVFIPLAEESGAILAIGEWVLRESCRLLSQTAYCEMDYGLSVNVSPRQLRQPGFVQQVKRILQETGAPPSQLTLEVTEGQFLSNMDDVVSTMKELRALGVHISIDDFGTGYSCLFYLQKLPLDEIKIDRSFVQSAPNDPSHAVLIDTILAIARQLGLGVVAEGIESPEQFSFLIGRGCPLFQGYHFGRPQPAGDFLATLGTTLRNPMMRR
jgi:diguanylate cyclase (GGDEF)-like protein/PAS domain S-box-containing protein